MTLLVNFRIFKICKTNTIFLLHKITLFQLKTVYIMSVKNKDLELIFNIFILLSVQYVRSTSGSYLLLVNGFTYVMESQFLKKMWWKCSHRLSLKCPAILVKNEDCCKIIANHNHNPIDYKINNKGHYIV